MSEILQFLLIAVGAFIVLAILLKLFKVSVNDSLNDNILSAFPCRVYAFRRHKSGKRLLAHKISFKTCVSHALPERRTCKLYKIRNIYAAEFPGA